MAYGQWVRHPMRPDWGLGKVLSQEGETVRILFSSGGERKLDLRYVSLELVEESCNSEVQRTGIRPRENVSLEKLETLCSQFCEEMKDNRRNTNDGKMALRVLQEMQNKGDLSRATRQQLLSWCRTEGHPYQRGVDLAQQICREIYGRIPTREETKD